MSESGSIPQGWTRCKLGDVVSVVRGVSYSKEQATTNFRPDYVPILRATNIGRSLDFDDLVYVDPSCVSEMQFLRQGDIVVAASSGSKSVVGKAAYFPGGWRGSFGAFCMGLRPDAEVEPKFVAYFLQTDEYRHRVSELSSGSNINNLKRDHIQSFPFRTAPRDVQRCIVAKLDELFSDLDAGVAALERAKANLKRYRAAVLKAAVEGKLTEEWRAEHPDVEPASKLLERILAERRQKWEADQLAKFTAAGKAPPKNWQAKYVEPAPLESRSLPELPSTWIWVSVDQVSVVVRGASPRPAGDPKYFGGPIPWITVGSLTAEDQPYLRVVKEGLTEEGKSNSRWIDEETLLLTNSGATLGVPKITKIGGCINDGSVALLYVDYPLKLHLYYALRSQTDSLRLINQGAAQPNLNTGIVKQIALPLCPSDEQERVVAILEERLSQISAAESEICKGLERANRLRQAILRQAFEGKLVVPQHEDTEETANEFARPVVACNE